MLLAALARDQVGQAGLAVASPVLAHHLMMRAVAEVLGVPKPAGMARALADSVREFLRLELGRAGLKASGQVWPGRVPDACCTLPPPRPGKPCSSAT